MSLGVCPVAWDRDCARNEETCSKSWWIALISVKPRNLSYDLLQHEDQTLESQFCRSIKFKKSEGELTFQNSSPRPCISAAVFALTPMISSIARTKRNLGLPITRSLKNGDSLQIQLKIGVEAILRYNSISWTVTTPRDMPSWIQSPHFQGEKYSRTREIIGLRVWQPRALHLWH